MSAAVWIACSDSGSSSVTVAMLPKPWWWPAASFPLLKWAMRRKAAGFEAAWQQKCGGRQRPAREVWRAACAAAAPATATVAPGPAASVVSVPVLPAAVQAAAQLTTHPWQQQCTASNCTPAGALGEQLHVIAALKLRRATRSAASRGTSCWPGPTARWRLPAARGASHRDALLPQELLERSGTQQTRQQPWWVEVLIEGLVLARSRPRAGPRQQGHVQQLPRVLWQQLCGQCGRRQAAAAAGAVARGAACTHARRAGHAFCQPRHQQRVTCSPAILLEGAPAAPPAAATLARSAEHARTRRAMRSSASVCSPHRFRAPGCRPKRRRSRG